MKGREVGIEEIENVAEIGKHVPQSKKQATKLLLTIWNWLKRSIQSCRHTPVTNVNPESAQLRNGSQLEKFFIFMYICTLGHPATGGSTVRNPDTSTDTLHLVFWLASGVRLELL